MNGPGIIVHGGAWNIPDDQWSAHLAGCRAAASAGHALLREGADAVEAVTAAVRVLEDDPTFDAGYGSVLNRDGCCELDAAVMEGAELHLGAVAAVRRLANPILAARLVMDQRRHCLLVGEGAELFARENGLELCDPAELVVEREAELWRRRRREGFSLEAEFQRGDTVGAVALDSAGNLAAANSTGGTGFKHPGRVGDSCLPGCGLYADNRFGACCCTGWGEQIMRLSLAARVILALRAGVAAVDAVDDALEDLRRMKRGRGGVIGLTPDGEILCGFNTPRLAWLAMDAVGGIEGPEEVKRDN
ncbi:MAG: peptidase T [Candidatus Coatesbacteria bacterium]|nr:peptidase T [Candidatus Coatesbacteria bacterium]